MREKLLQFLASLQLLIGTFKIQRRWILKSLMIFIRIQLSCSTSKVMAIFSFFFWVVNLSQSLLLYKKSNFPSLSTIIRWTEPIYTLISPCMQHKVVLLAIKLWVRIPGDSPSALFNYLCVNFQKCVSVARTLRFNFIKILCNEF